ncbi:MAG: hypothetical protein REI95_06385 [Oxalicibacterium faecigallinarum]|uniref:hypothetical protein n=1 Tax=Oxalicibacterium faecigallinarum TaxID=573741 RepID=UPI002808A256|nr:hypothetical protein [Oxalicibacterium faecigallinarum]MDQ7969255.1 hypothetical protein [Oxalicibacterium faecigallinarum]
MKKLLIWFEVTVALLMLLIISALLFVIFPSRSDAGVWDVVTSVGTVFAFFGVIGVARWELEQRRLERREKGEVILQTVLALLYEQWYLIRVATDWLQRLEPGVAFVEYRTQYDGYFDDLCNAIKDIPVHELPRPSDIPANMAVIRSLSGSGEAIAKVAAVFNDLSLKKSDYERADKALMHIRGTCINMIIQWRAGIVDFGAVPHEPPKHLANLPDHWREDKTSVDGYYQQQGYSPIH